MQLFPHTLPLASSFLPPLRDPKHRSFYYAKEFDKSQPLKSSTKLTKDLNDSEPPVFKTITPRGSKASEVQDILQGVVGNFVGFSRAVRQHILPDKLLEVRAAEGKLVMKVCKCDITILCLHSVSLS